MTTVTVDAKGRLTIPKEDRAALNIKPGDTFFVEREGQTLRYARAENPFEALAEEAIREHRAGRTHRLGDRSAGQ